MALYEFVDIPTNQEESTSALPAEAMSYNGIYIENEITGYRTLYTSGRELLVSELQTGEINGIDGARYLGRRRPVRTITVGYQLIADSASDFRTKFNKLNSLLRGEQVQIIFADESDKYFVGTKTGNTTVESGRNAIIGEIEITCTDPYKYSVTEKSFSAENVNGNLMLLIDNEGSEPCAIRYEVLNKADNGFFSFSSTNGVMRFGNPAEVDGETYQGNETLCTIANWPATKVSASAMHPNTNSYNYTGTMKRMNVNGTSAEGIVIDSFGNRASGKWNGCCYEFVLPADSVGDTGAKNFYAWMAHWFMTGKADQTGEQGVAFVTSDNKLICGFQIVKSDTGGNNAYAEWFVNGQIKRQINFQPTIYDSDNPFNGRGANDIRKEGDKVTFYWWGSHFSFVDPEIKDMVCTKIQVTFDNFGTRTSYVSVNAITELKFEKMNVNGWKDVPNRYSAGDNLEVDGNTSKVFINGMYRPEDELIGTEYFKADPGMNEVRVMISEWCSISPEIIAYIREVWQ